MYEVSNLGRVRSWKLTGNTKRRLDEPRYLVLKIVGPGFYTGRGYRAASLWKDNKEQQYYAHRLVAAAFIGPLPDGKEVAHLNGVPDDNRAVNLIYATRSENHLHKRAHGTSSEGERSPHAKLTDEDVLFIWDYPVYFGSSAYLADKFGVSRPTMTKLRQKKSWKYLIRAQEQSSPQGASESLPEPS